MKKCCEINWPYFGVILEEAIQRVCLNHLAVSQFKDYLTRWTRKLSLQVEAENNKITK